MARGIRFILEGEGSPPGGGAKDLGALTVLTNVEKVWHHYPKGYKQLLLGNISVNFESARLCVLFKLLAGTRLHVFQHLRQLGIPMG